MMGATISNDLKKYKIIHVINDRANDIIHDDILRSLPTNNDEFYIKHKTGPLTVALKK